NNIDSIDWLPQSPDLNLIEALWAHMETELGETFGRISDLKTLKDVLKSTWDNTITRDMLDNLIKSMPRRLSAVIAAGGDATPY
ncbi:transposable element Tc3 transposase, partial [Morchella conica CCBAS932]